ncbi:hypothetical protein HGB24_01990 [Candidatus Saccharibacteria bacterium]|nr:hypothetical protein [Candidatus Saccharibacteria bacterium]
MKLIIWLLDKLHQLIGKLREYISRYTVRKDERLYSLRYDVLLFHLGITSRIEADNIRKELSPVNSEKSFRRVAERVGRRYNVKIADLQRAYLLAMKVKAPTIITRLGRVLSSVIKFAFILVVTPFIFLFRIIRSIFTWMWQHKWLTLLIIALLAGFAYWMTKSRTITVNNPVVAPVITCDIAPWTMQAEPTKNNPNYELFKGGFTEIRDAKTDSDAQKAFDTWLNGRGIEGKKKPSPQDYGVRAYREILVETGKGFGIAFDEAALSKNGEAANDQTRQLVCDIKASVAKVTPDKVTWSGYNTELKNSQVFGYFTPGVQGDQRALRVELKNGNTIWILAQCGNLFSKEDRFKHEEHRDHHDEPECEGQECPDHKISGQDPAARGNAITGGGRNQDPGPGEHQSIGEVIHPRNTQRVNSAAPVTTTVVQNGAVADTIPAPKTEASTATGTPSEPVSGEALAPGIGN